MSGPDYDAMWEQAESEHVAENHRIIVSQKRRVSMMFTLDSLLSDVVPLTRVRNVVKYGKECGDLEDLSVRGVFKVWPTPKHWLRRKNLGPKNLREMVEILAGLKILPQGHWVYAPKTEWPWTQASYRRWLVKGLEALCVGTCSCECCRKTRLRIQDVLTGDSLIKVD